MHVHGCTICMQDGTPCYRSKIVTDFPKKKTVENMWTIMKDKVEQKQPLGAQNLSEAIKFGALKSSKGYCESLVFSMPCHIKAVIDSKGGLRK